MPYHFPRLQFDRTKYVSLNEAFHILGSYKFPSDWTGNEISAFAEWPSTKLRETKDRLAQEETLAYRKLEDLRVALHEATNQETYNKFEALVEAATTKRDLAKTACREFIRSYDGREADAEAFARRQEVEAILFRAIREAELDTYLEGGTNFKSITKWTDSQKFQVCFPYSYIVTGLALGGRTRHPAYFDANEFEVWSMQFQRHLSKFRFGDVHDDLIQWFKAVVREHSVKGTRLKRDEVFEHCKQGFSRANEIEKLRKATDAVWDLYAPAPWTKGGR